jgi:hypothetical protein
MNNSELKYGDPYYCLIREDCVISCPAYDVEQMHCSSPGFYWWRRNVSSSNGLAVQEQRALQLEKLKVILRQAKNTSPSGDS